MRSVAQSCSTLYDPMDCSPPGSSVHGIFPGKKITANPFLTFVFLRVRDVNRGKSNWDKPKLYTSLGVSFDSFLSYPFSLIPKDVGWEKVLIGTICLYPWCKHSPSRLIPSNRTELGSDVTWILWMLRKIQ